MDAKLFDINSCDKLSVEGTDQYRILFERIQVGIFLTDEHFTILDGNPAALQLTGYSAATLTQLPVTKVVPLEFQAHVLSELLTKGTFSGELPIVCSTGRHLWCLATATRLRENRFAFALADISARKTAEEELQRERDLQQRLLDAAPALDPDGRSLYLNRFLETLSGRSLDSVRRQDGITEEELRATSKRLRAILDTSPMCIRVLDAEGRVLEMNRAGLEMIEAESLEQAQSFKSDDFLLPEHRASFRTALQRVLRGESIYLQSEMVTLRGTHRWVEHHFVGLEDPADPGKIYQVLGVTRDVTSQKRNAAELRDREEQLRVFIENVPVGVAMLDRELRYLAHSRRWLTVYGMADQDLRGRSHYDLFPNLSDECREIHRRCLLGVADSNDEEKVVRSDGTVCYLRWALLPWWNAAGEVGGVLFFTENVTDQVLAKQSIRDSEQRMAEAQQVAQLGSWNWELTGDRITWSDETYRIFGHPPQSFVPRYAAEFLDAVHPEDRPQVIKAVEQSLCSGNPYQVEHRIRRPDGTERLVRERGKVVLDAARQPVRMYGTVQDITEKKHADQQLMQLREQLAHLARVGAIGELAAGITHELNQPLTAIAADAYTLQSILGRVVAPRMPQDIAVCRELARSLEAQALRAGAIIGRMKGLIRQRNTYRAPVELERLVEGVVELLVADLRLAQIEFTSQIPGDLPLISVDSVQIQQVLFNLCRNAIEAMCEQSGPRMLAISAAVRNAAFVEIRVRDSGPGCSLEVADRQFEPFFTTKPDGLGIGLSISRQIVEAHGGALDIVPEVSVGAEFCFTVPITTEDY